MDWSRCLPLISGSPRSFSGGGEPLVHFSQYITRRGIKANNLNVAYLSSKRWAEVLYQWRLMGYN
jgi:hypothetical protein